MVVLLLSVGYVPTLRNGLLDLKLSLQTAPIWPPGSKHSEKSSLLCALTLYAFPKAGVVEPCPRPLLNRRRSRARRRNVHRDIKWLSSDAL